MKSAVTIAKGLIQDKAVHEAIAKKGSRFVLIYDRLVENQLMPLKEALNALCLPLQGGESCKSRAVKEYLEDCLLEAGMGSDCVIIACGGGTVLDVAGFVAATFCRGVPLCLFPTTLLAMVDAAIGGKNGINVGKNKNCLGTIYHPQDIFIDTAFLDTLSSNQMQNGFAEMLKISLVCGKPQKVDVSHIEEAVQMKMQIVEKSLSEPKVRDLLNFGHTFAHAYEALTDFRIEHGRAVLLGMAAETFVSHCMGHLSKEAHDAIQKEILQVGKPCIQEKFSKDAWFDALDRDKKNMDGDIHMVLLCERAKPLQMKSSKVAKKFIEQAINWLQAQRESLVVM